MSLSATLIAAPMPRVPPVTIATRAMFLSSYFSAGLCAGKPACKLAPDQRVEQRHPLGAVVEAFEQGEMLAAGLAERVAAADAKLFQRLQAVSGKAWRGDSETRDALARIGGQHDVGGRLQPFR